MTIDKLIDHKEFEQNLSHETERKFVPIFPQQLEQFRAEARPIEQFYLSHPDEPFSLRLREMLSAEGELVYIATLKDNGTITADGIRRIEVEAPVSAALYAHYRDSQGKLPIVRKLRAEPLPGIAIDFYESGDVLIESENPAHWEEFGRLYSIVCMEVTGDRSASNEWIAHLSFRREHSGNEAFTLSPELIAADIVNDLLADTTDGAIASAHIAGRSGSGKSTLVAEVRTQLERLGIPCIVISTDDYHRGATWLTAYNQGQPWEKWDDPIVYDTEAMAADLAELRAVRPVWSRRIDFSNCEPTYDGVLQPAPVILIEGIYAFSPDIYHPSARRYEMTTPLATCMGRRLLRDMRERPEFADSIKSLHYMLAEAEPAYREQLRPAGVAQ
jgi:uridine kinase